MTRQAQKEQFRAALAPGSLFEGKYRIERHIGAGSFAYVLKARHEVMDRDVALKVLKPEIVNARPDVADRFVHEARIVSKLRHPNTVTVFDFGTTEKGLSYMVMEYVEGEPLDEILAREGALSPHRVSRITQQILKALDEAHNIGIVHRDLKPANIMLTEVHGETDSVKVLDFGVAKLVGEGDRPKQKHERRSTQFVGTPIYMSPEQVLGEDVVPASDLYALGLIVYEMLTGEDPIDAPTVATVAQIHIDPDPIPFRRIDRLGPEYRHLILKATERDPNARLRNVGEFARKLPIAGGVDVSAEFSGLLTDGSGAPPSLENEISEASWDAFSGKNYIEAPEEDVERTRPKARRPSGRRKAVANRPERHPAPQRDLQVDVGRVRRDEIQKSREGRSAKTVWARDGDPVRDGAWILAGLLAGFVSFTIASTVFVQTGGSGRALVGLLPFGAAFVATWFSPTRRVAGGFFASLVLPLARYMCIMLGALVLLVAVLFPESAASTLSLDADWFLRGTAEDSVVRTATKTLGDGLSALFSFASRVIPW